jgi:hypothetical protein
MRFDVYHFVAIAVSVHGLMTREVETGVLLAPSSTPRVIWARDAGAVPKEQDASAMSRLSV